MDFSPNLALRRFCLQKSRFSDSQTLAIIEQAEHGAPAFEPSVSTVREAQFYTWRAKYGGVDASMMALLTELEEASRGLRKLYAEVCIEVSRGRTLSRNLTA